MKLSFEEICGTSDKKIKAYASKRLIEVTATLEVMEQGRIADARGILRNMAIRLAWDSGDCEVLNSLNRK